MRIKISIITATFNSGRTLADCLNSVARQEYDQVEHILVDGGSRDETVAIAKAFTHVATIVSEPDNGIYDAMNKGIRLTTGDVIGILNSDDVLANNTVLQKVADAFSDPSVEALYADLQYVKADDLQVVVRYWRSGSFRRRNFYLGWMPPHPTFFVRRTVYERFGLFNTDFSTSADYELMLRMLLKHEVNVYYLPEVTVKMRMGGLSNSSLSHRLKANREDRRAWNVNGLRPKFYTLYLKPVSKLGQFFFHKLK